MILYKLNSLEYKTKMKLKYRKHFSQSLKLLTSRKFFFLARDTKYLLN